MSFDPKSHIRTQGKWIDGGILELSTHVGTIEAYRWDGLCIEQGRRMVLRLGWVAESGTLDLSSGYTADFQIRTTRDTSTSALLALDESSGITLGSGNQNITVEITAAQSAALTFSRAYYELTVTHTASSTAMRLLCGACEVSRRASA